MAAVGVVGPLLRLSFSFDFFFVFLYLGEI